MDASAHYRHLLTLGREEFLGSAAPAALVRHRHAATNTIDHALHDLDPAEETLPHGYDLVVGGPPVIEVYPLTKKPGASFPDRITIGRTPNNDIVIDDHSVSRLHAYVRLDGGQWLVADAGSKNGSWLASASLQARKERQLPSTTVLRLGDVEVTFYLAHDLYAALGGA